MPFFFQHGLGAQLAQPQGLLKNLPNTQLISMDCPGHGATALPAGKVPSFDYYADELLLLMDRLGIHHALFGGISMGAGISINIALRYPQRVKGLVLIRPAWLDQASPENLALLKTASALMPTTNGSEEFKQLDTFQRIQQNVPNAAKSILGVFAATQRKELPLVLKSMVEDKPFQNLNALSAIKQPCLILANEDDPLHPYEMAVALHNAIPDSRLEKVVSRYVDDQAHRKAVEKAVKLFIATIP